MVKRISLLVLCLGLFMAGSAAARDISFSSGLTQDDFKHLTKEAGTAMAYRNTAPAEPLGITGFDAGIEVSAVSIKKDGTNNYWQNAFNGNAPSYLYLPKIRVRKGLPFGIDVGAMYSYVPDSNIKLYGARSARQSWKERPYLPPSASAPPTPSWQVSAIWTCRRSASTLLSARVSFWSPPMPVRALSGSTARQRAIY